MHLDVEALGSRHLDRGTEQPIYDSYHGTDLRLSQIAAEINAGRPLAVDITWLNSSASHVVAIAGVLGDSLLILDPANGQSVVRFGDFPGTYFGGAKLDGYTFTKR